jgi:CYTH domain-containing protein
MPVEIERRFVVRDPCAAIAARTGASFHITQGYFGHVDGLRMRVRVLWGDHDECTAFLTFKGARHGICRLEYEYPVEVARAWRALNCLSPKETIRKKRHRVLNHDGSEWSVDQFEGPNQGLFIAEVELSHPHQKVSLPSWAGEEITFDPRYGNSQLARTPMPYVFGGRARASNTLRPAASPCPDARGLVPFASFLGAVAES